MASRTAYTSVPVDGIRRHIAINQKRQSRISAATDSGWIVEIISLIVGSLLLGALAAILRVYDGKQPPHLGSSLGGFVTLNTITVIIGAAMQAAISYPVVECLGQLKWHWMSSKERKLEDLQIFDQATRGFFGASLLLGKLHVKTIGSLGALVVVLGVALNPFLQQLISTVSQSTANVAGGSAYATAARYYAESYATNSTKVDNAGSTSAHGPSSQFQPSPGMLGAITGALYAQNGSIDPLAPVCSSGNCTFDTYQTLGVCAGVVDITVNVTSEVVIDSSEIYTRFNLSNISYHSVDSRSHYGNVLQVFEPPHGILGDSFYLILDVVVLALTQDKQAIAYEIMLDWCVQNITTTVNNGVSRTEVEPVGYVDLGIHNISTSPELITTANGLFNVSLATHATIGSYLRDLVTGSVSTSIDGAPATTSVSISAILNAIYSADQHGIEVLANNLATSMSNFMRSPQASRYQEDSGIVVQGVAYQDITIVVIRWYWIVGPVLFIIISAVFVVLVIILTKTGSSRPFIWKTSGLAMIHALDLHARSDLNGLPSISELQEQDKQVMVRLLPVQDSHRWSLVLSPAARSESEED